MRTVICDAEFNGLDNPDTCWCVVCKDLENDEVRTFLRPDQDSNPLRSYLRGADRVVGHNFIQYDFVYMTKLIKDLDIDPLSVFDTMVASQYLDYNIKSGHSLNEWGKRLGVFKLHAGEGQEFFQRLSPELVERCESDVEVTSKLYLYLTQEHLTSQDTEALSAEFKTAFICREISDNGFSFDYDKAVELHKEISSKLERLKNKLQKAFPPRSKLIREVTPKATKSGAIHLGDFRWLPEPRDMTPFSVGATFCRFKWEHFNPGSTKQIIERLNDAGWKPTDKTKGHIEFLRARNGSWPSKQSASSKQSTKRDSKGQAKGSVHAGTKDKQRYFEKFGWKVNEVNLNTLPKDAPLEARQLANYILLDSRRSTLEEWIKAYNHDTRRIHGRFNPIGAWTHRKSHRNPNMANIPRSSNPHYGRSFRELWRVPNGKLLLGTDATGIQLRVLAHYINDPEFTREVTEGDVHSLNRKTLGEVCKSRANAKTFIYAWLLGAGVGKVSEILRCSVNESKKAIDNFISRYDGLKKLKDEVIPRDAKRGYFIGFDGRKILCSSEHLMLSGYLQAGESVIMKHACIAWHDRLKKEGVPFWQVNDVHDEWQTEVEDDLDLAHYIGTVQRKAIQEAGEKFSLNCPMDGEYNIGRNWYQTH